MNIDMYLQVFVVFCAFIFVFIVLNSLKKKVISTKLSLLWMLSAVILVFFAIYSEPIFYISKLLGFEKPVNMVFFLAFLFLLVIVFYLCIITSKQQEDHKLLIQEISLLKKRIDDEEKEGN